MKASRAAAWAVPFAAVLLAAFFVPRQGSRPGRDIEWTDANK